MTMPVTPGGTYFGLYSDFDDVGRGEAVSYSTAVASAGAAGSRDVLDLAIPEYLRQSATNAAITAYNLACAPTMLPRVKTAESGSGGN